MGSIVADARERNEDYLHVADERRLLSYPNPDDPAHPFSYDFHLTLEDGEEVKVERKRWDDAISSFIGKGGNKLDRQLAAVDWLILEWDYSAILSHAAGMVKKDRDRFMRRAKATHKRICRLAAFSRVRVIPVTDSLEGSEILRYLADHRDPHTFDEPSLGVR